MFRAICESPWVATAAVAAASFAALAVWLRRKPFLVAFFVLFTVEILADALRSGSWSPLHLLASPWEDAIGIGFVLLGDFRFFLLIERFARRPTGGPLDATAPRAWAGAAALTLVVPVVAAVANRALSGRFSDVRWTYLIYEALFVVFALVLRLAVLPRRLAALPDAVRAWLLGIAGFEIVQYSLWVLADAIILGGADAGFALRVVPNAMYYAIFLPYVAFRAPVEVDPG
jgi:hypothetical protein